MSDFLKYLEGNQTEIWSQVYEHFRLTLTSIVIASITGISIGALIGTKKKLAPAFLSFVNVLQTIPSLALLGFLIPLIGIGVLPAIVALFLYALLPIVRNTFTGITEIDESVIEAGRGLGMSRMQLLTKVQLPLAAPLIIAGIRTASVINVGVATLCALIAAGGLGESIFGGISLNNTNMILAGAIPASVMALLFDGFFGLVQRFTRHNSAIALYLLPFMLAMSVIFFIPKKDDYKMTAGFNSEFIQRADGFLGLDSVYGLPVRIKELEIGLMYKALANGDVDFIDGFSTDGRVKAYDLKLLTDDKKYFPPYYAAPLVNQSTLAKYPQLERALNLLTGKIDDAKMAQLNLEVDQNKKSPEEVATEFLQELGYDTEPLRDTGDAQITIGCKSFTESYILAHIFGQLISSQTGLSVSLKTGFGGTKLLFDAMKTNEIDLYPEYTGTGLLVLLNPGKSKINELLKDSELLNEYLRDEFKDRHGMIWLGELGFNNTFAIMMRRQQAEILEIESISDLSEYLKK
ncbi:MAG: ABC transporter permease/substrate-binding protein [Cyclobacteriaceae bacterium]